MAETQPGGIYRRGDQWVDANGEPIKAPDRRAVRAHNAEQEAAERELEAAEAQAETLPARRRNQGG